MTHDEMFELLKPQLNSIEIDNIQTGKNVLRKCVTADWELEGIKIHEDIYSISDSLTLESIRTFNIMTCQTAPWKQYVNRFLKYFKLMVI